MSVFSIISGAYKEIIQVPTVMDVIEDKAKDITSYLQKIDRVRQADSLKADVYDDTIEYIKKSYLYGVI
jgi:hypothetical protein